MLLQSDISCRVYHVCVGFITQFNVWLHVALVIELFVISVFPKKLNSESSMERAHFLSLLMLAVLLILNMNYFWTIKRQKVVVSSYKIFTATYRYMDTFSLNPIKVWFEKCDMFQSLNIKPSIEILIYSIEKSKTVVITYQMQKMILLR